MGVFNPVFSPLAGESSRRRFDPYPDALLALDFAGINPSGRPFYKRDGIISPRFEMMRGASSVGGAGFGTTIVNGVYETLAPNTPLIGDGGLRNAEARTELVGLSCRPALWYYASGTTTVGQTHKGVFQSARIASGGAAWHRAAIPSSVSNVVNGQLYTVIARYIPGTSGRCNIELRNATAATRSNAIGQIGALAVDEVAAGSLSIVEDNIDEGGGVRRTVLAWTPNFTGSINQTGIGPHSTVVGQDIEVLGLSIQAGPYIDNPPIDNENLPATRTGYSYRETGLNIAPVHYGVARARLVAAAANHLAAFPRFLALRGASGLQRIYWLCQKSDGTQRVQTYNDVGAGPSINPGVSPVVGQYQTLAWAHRAGSFAISLDGAAVQSLAAPSITTPFTRIGYMEDGVGASASNAETEFVFTRDGEISNDALQALSARFTA